MTFWGWPRRLLDLPRALLEPRVALERVTGHAEPPEPELSIDADGWLVVDGPASHLAFAVERVPSVRHSPLTTPMPIAILWHFTATDHGSAKNLAKRIRKYKRKVDRAASWHVCIGADGTLWQSVSFLRGSWHCAKGTIAGHRVNGCSVGIELEGHGDAFPGPQIGAACSLVRALREAYNISAVQAERGHREFDPKRRSDPGPVWEGILPGLIENAYR